MLDRLAEAARIQLSYETDGIYAQAVRLRGHPHGMRGHGVSDLLRWSLTRSV